MRGILNHWKYWRVFSKGNDMTLIEKAWEYAYTVFKDNTYEEKMIAKKVLLFV